MIDEAFNFGLASEPTTARLMPSVAAANLEERTTSILLAVFRVVPAFAKEVLSELKTPSGKVPFAKKASIQCFTEVRFLPTPDSSTKLRPDGLITLVHGKKRWSALVEAKVGSSELKPNQIEQYLDLAKANGIDAVITISNQFVADPSFHPVKVRQSKLKKVGLFHFSWISIATKAILIDSNTGVDDPEQVFILRELVRYLRHDQSGVKAFTQMGPHWKKVCSDVTTGVQLRNGDDAVKDAVSSFHQLMRYLSLEMSQQLGVPVTWILSSRMVQAPEEHLQTDIKMLVNESRFESKFRIPNTADDITLTADLKSRTLSFSMTPKHRDNVKNPTAVINWLTKQFKDLEDYPVRIRAFWPNRRDHTSKSLQAIIDEPKVLVPENVSKLPRQLDIMYVKVVKRDRFAGSKAFVEDTLSEFRQFYEKVGQRLKAWVPRPPQIEPAEEVTTKEESLDERKYHYLYYASGVKHQKGPVDRNEVLKVANKAGIKVWHEGLETWLPFKVVFP